MPLLRHCLIRVRHATPAVSTAVLFAGVHLLLLNRLVVQGYRVEGRCMEPRLCSGERFLGDKITFRFREPRRGDVVVFRYPLDPTQLYVKRIIATGGETIGIHDGIVTVNDRVLSEPYLHRPMHGDMATHWVRPGAYFLMGDNRDVSDDSRSWGDLDADAIIARSTIRYWPLRAQ